MTVMTVCGFLLFVFVHLCWVFLFVDFLFFPLSWEQIWSEPVYAILWNFGTNIFWTFMTLHELNLKLIKDLFSHVGCVDTVWLSQSGLLAFRDPSIETGKIHRSPERHAKAEPNMMNGEDLLSIAALLPGWKLSQVTLFLFPSCSGFF